MQLAIPRALRMSEDVHQLSVEIQIRWFKWEFLRRNEDYKRDFAEYEAQFGQWFKLNGRLGTRQRTDYKPEAWSFLCKEIVPAISTITKRWGISEPVKPGFSFDQSGFGFASKRRIFLPFFNGPQDGNERDRKALEGELPAGERERIEKTLNILEAMSDRDQPSQAVEDYRFINVSIDITKPLEDTFASLEESIDFRRQVYRARIGPLPDHRRKPRLRLDQYSNYLKVRDLRRIQKLSFEQIALELFSVEMAHPYSRGPIIKRVRTHFKRACELVCGGYRQIES